MKRSSRRGFIQQAGAVVAATVTHPASRGVLTPAFPAFIPRSIPPHQAIALPGIHGYADTHSIAAGGVIRFHVSSTVPHQVSIVRLGLNVDDPSGDELMATLQASPADPQPIHPGSYVVISKRLRRPLETMTIECWVRPWSLDRLQGLISQEDKQDSRGFALGIGKGGYVGLYIGDGVSPDEAVIHRTPEGALKRRRWHHVVGRWDGATKEIWVDGRRLGSWPFRGPCLPGPHPLRLAAMSDMGLSTHFLDGDLAMPAIHRRALSPEEILRRLRGKGLEPSDGPDLLGFWPLSEERGDRLSDASGHGRHGRIINHATWMIGGPAFESDRVPRFGPYDPASDPSRGHGLRFAADDLYDCRWRPNHSWRVPSSAKPGVYVARIQALPDDSSPALNPSQGSPVTFVVRRNARRPKARILVLCSTSTWIAYNSAPFCEPLPPGVFLGTEGYKNSHPDAPAYSCYRDHRAGQPSYQFGLRMPWPAAGPQVLYSSRKTGYSHLMRGERFLHVWLEREGYEYDLATDLDLHRNPSMLCGYRTVIVNGHSEYWSREAMTGLDLYLRRDGTAVVLSGNTMFWRTTFSPDGTVMECRKFDERIGGRGGAAVGELYHSHDGQRGSLLRECGLPAWKVVGLECCGWGGVESTDAGVYHTLQPDHFLFQRPEAVGLAAGDTFGHAPGGLSHRAVGHEFDVRPGRLVAMTTKVPAGGALPVAPAGMTTLAVGRRSSQVLLDYFAQPVTSDSDIRAEMIYWERPEGGRVFHAGAIGAGWSLSVDPRLQALMRNVLHAFGIGRTR